MYCKNCGKPNNDGDQFCQYCGAPINEQDAPVAENLGFEAEAPAPRKKLSKKTLIGICAGAAAAVVLAVVLILVFSLGGSNSPEGVVQKYIKASQNRNLEDMISACYPDDLLEKQLKKHDMTRSEYKRALKEAQEEYDDYSDEEDLKYSWKIIDSETLDKDDLKTLNERYRDEFDTSKRYISEARELTIEIKYTDEDGEEYEHEAELTVVKIDGKWYISLLNVYNPLNAIF